MFYFYQINVSSVFLAFRLWKSAVIHIKSRMMVPARSLQLKYLQMLGNDTQHLQIKDAHQLLGSNPNVEICILSIQPIHNY
jgi:hypothetical protein